MTVLYIFMHDIRLCDEVNNIDCYLFMEFIPYVAFYVLKGEPYT
jgi:hypothetical protein